jgi:hypothetical protein
VKLLGQDDWLFFARREDGTLVYTVVETNWHWLEAPHGGECRPRHRLNCDGETRTTCRLDSTWMHEYVRAHMSEFDWQECGDDPVSGEYLGWAPEGDEAFAAKSRRTYLID